MVLNFTDPPYSCLLGDYINAELLKVILYIGIHYLSLSVMRIAIFL